jgi:tRNA synthetases class I (E and Q), catalytic domain
MKKLGSSERENEEPLLNSLQEEFETTIMEDLQMMEIVGDKVSHSSDYFDVLAEYAVNLIKSGKAYADDTEGAIVCRTVVHCIAQRQTSLR